MIKGKTIGVPCKESLAILIAIFLQFSNVEHALGANVLPENSIWSQHIQELINHGKLKDAVKALDAKSGEGAEYFYLRGLCYLAEYDQKEKQKDDDFRKSLSGSGMVNGISVSGMSASGKTIMVPGSIAGLPSTLRQSYSYLTAAIRKKADTRFYRARATVLLRMSMDLDALENLCEAIRVDPKCIKCRIQRIKLLDGIASSHYADSGDFSTLPAFKRLRAALPLVQRMAKDYRANNDHSRSVGWTCPYQRVVDETVLNDWEAVINVVPTSVEYLKQYSMLCILLQTRVPQAIAALTKAIALEKTSVGKAQLLDLRATGYMQLKNFSSANIDFTSAIENSPLCTYYISRAKSFEKLGKNAEAESDFDLVARQKDCQLDAAIEKGNYYFRTKQFEKAIDSWSKKSEGPYGLSGHDISNIALAYLEMGQFRKGAQHCIQLLDSPRDDQSWAGFAPHYLLAKLLQKCGDLERAKQECQKSLEQAKQESWTLKILANSDWFYVGITESKIQELLDELNGLTSEKRL